MKRIMIVDDSLDMQEIYKDLFSDKANEYEVELMADAKEAYACVLKGGYDMIILDVIMDSMDGNTFYILLRLQENKLINSIPVLVVSVLNPKDLRMLDVAGRVDFLQKPITKQQLFGKIESLCGCQQAPQ